MAGIKDFFRSFKHAFFALSVLFISQSAWAACTASQIDVDGTCKSPAVTITPVTGTTTFSVQIQAAGTFYLDCGLYNSGAGGTVQKFTVTTSTPVTQTCSYGTATTSSARIKLYGTATAYSTTYSVPAIKFTTPAAISSISGSLGTMFPTLTSGSQLQPRFYQTFYGATKLSSIPSGLFSGISGTPTDYMFYETFRGCTKLNSVPSALFSNLSGSLSNRTFYQTFYQCSAFNKFSDKRTYLSPDFFGNLSRGGVYSVQAMVTDTGLASSCPTGTTENYYTFDTDAGKPWCSPNTYSIAYDFSYGETHGTYHPTTATFDTTFRVSKPTLSGYEFAGWAVSGMDSSVTHYYGTTSTPTLTATGTSMNLTLTVVSQYFKNLRATSGTVTFRPKWTKTCNPGYYYKESTSSCATCPAGSYCPGLTFYIEDREDNDMGIYSCGTGYTSAAGTNEQSKCYMSGSYTTTCLAHYFQSNILLGSSHFTASGPDWNQTVSCKKYYGNTMYCVPEPNACDSVDYSLLTCDTGYGLKTWCSTCGSSNTGDTFTGYNSYQTEATSYVAVDGNGNVTGTASRGNLANGEFKSVFSYGTVRGQSLCSETAGTVGSSGTPSTTPGDDGYSNNCWCKLTAFTDTNSVAQSLTSPYYRSGLEAYGTSCNTNCAQYCAESALGYHGFEPERYTLYNNSTYRYCEANTYSISYNLNSGTHGTSHPTSATYDSVFQVSIPSRGDWVFSSWTISNADSNTHYYGFTSTPTSTSTATSFSTDMLSTYFKNLRATSGTVTFTANWVCPAGKTLNSSTGTCDECPAGTYKNNWGNQECTPCPAITRDSGAVMPASSYPAGWHLNEGGTDYLWEARIQNWSTGLTSISQCRAIYTLENTRGILRNEGVYYNTTTQKYDTIGEYAHDYYIQIKPGYYGSTQYYDGTSACSSSDSERNMLYQDAIQCPAGSYCPGFVDTNWWAIGVPKCNDANYDYTQSTIGKYACVSNDLSNAGADSCATAVTLNANGGSSSTPSTVYVRYNKGIYSTLANAKAGTSPISKITTNPAKTGNYAYGGFYTATTGGTKVIERNGNFANTAKTQVELNGTSKTWHARYQQVYTVTLDSQQATTGGTSSLYAVPTNSNNVVSGIYADNKATQPAWLDGGYDQITKPTKTGYTFAGYYNTSATTGGTRYIDADGKTNDALDDAASDSTGDFTIYARWTPNTYTVSYNLNNGSFENGTDHPTTATYGTAFHVSNPTPPSGWEFAGWTITGMDSNTHYYGSSSNPLGTSTASSMTSATSDTYFKNLRATSGTVTFSARWSKTCGSGITGEYFNATNKACATCPAGFYCSGSVTGYYDTSADIGKTSCNTDSLTGFTSAAGAKSVTQCYKTSTTSCDAYIGTFANGYELDDANATGVVYGNTSNPSSVSCKIFREQDGTNVSNCIPEANVCEVTGYACNNGYSSTVKNSSVMSDTSSVGANWVKAFNSNGSFSYYNASSLTREGLANGAFRIGGNGMFNGRALCSGYQSVSAGGSPEAASGQYCWCKSTSYLTSGSIYPAQSDWFYMHSYTSQAECEDTCSTECVEGFSDDSTFSINVVAHQHSFQCTPNNYEITLDTHGATTNGTTKLYTIYSTGVYTDSARENKMTSSANPITTPTKTGYTFAGYYSAVTGGLNLIKNTGYLTSFGNSNGVSATSNSTTWHARWTPVTYNILSEYNSGSCTTANPTTYDIESSTITLCTPTRKGYTFGGWYTSSDFSGSAVTQIATGSTGNKNFYAKWTADCNAVTLNANSGTAGSVTTIYKKTDDATWYSNNTCTTQYTTNANVVPTRSGYAFRGFTEAALEDASVGNNNITALITKTGAINSNYGTSWIINEPKTIYAAWAQNCTLPSHGTCSLNIDSDGFMSYTSSCSTGYTIRNNTSGTATPVCDANTCTVTFKTGNSTMGTQNFTYGTAQQLTNVTSLNNIPVSGNGWTFVGWGTDAGSSATYTNQQSLSDICTTNGENITLYGIWKRNVSFVYYDGAEATSTTTSTREQFYNNTTASEATLGSVETYALATQSSYSWAPQGWVLNSTTGKTRASSATTTTGYVTPAANGAAIYYALYTRSSKFVYKGNNSTSGSTENTKQSQVFNAGSSTARALDLTLAENGFARYGYTFNKWAMGSARGTQYAPGETIAFPNNTWTTSRSYNVYATWMPITYTVAYAGMSGASYGANHPTSATFDTAFTVNTPSKNGYTFTGWDITGMDSTTHTYGSSTTTDSEISGTSETSFKNLRATSGTVTFTATWTPNTYPINYHNIDGAENYDNPSGYSIVSSDITLKTATKDGKVFLGWCTDSGLTTCSLTQTIPTGSTGAKDFWAKWMDSEFKMEVTGTEFSLKMSATGTFYVDWGDGSAEKIIRSTTTEETYTHTFLNSAASHFIRFAGEATGYNTGNVAAIRFCMTDTIGHPGSDSNAAKIKAISGSLGAIFHTIGSGAQITQPRFYRTFKHASGIKSIPETLFCKTPDTPAAASCVKGAPVSSMFYETFYNAGINSSIPAKLFAGIEGAPADNMFQGTFSSILALMGPLPAGLFAGISGAPANGMYANTFQGSQNLSGSIPLNFFGNITGDPQPYMFYETFYSTKISGIVDGATTTTFIPYTFLGGINKATSASSTSFSNMFTYTSLASTCPDGYMQYKVNSVDYFSGAGKPWCELGVYNISYTMNSGTNYNGAPETYTYLTGATINGTPTRAGYTFAGWTGSNGDTPQTTVVISTSDYGDKSYTANWTPNVYTMTLNTNCPVSGGSTNQTVYQKYAAGWSATNFGTTITKVTVPTCPGYTFRGFYTSQVAALTANGNTGTQKFTASGTINAGNTNTSNTTYYGAWAQNCSAGTGATCSLSVSDAGAVTYATSCDEGYYNLTNSDKYNPSCSAIVVSTPTNHLTYNGSDQTCPGITVTTPSSGNTIKYGTASGTYNNNTPHTIKNYGTTTVYYKVTTSDSNVKTGSYTCYMDKADGSTIFKDGTTTVTSGSTAFNGTKSLTVACSENGTLANNSVTSGTTSVATAANTGNSVTLTSVKTGSSVITANCPATNNYKASSGTYTWTVSNGTISVTAADKSKTYDGNAQTCSITASAPGSTATIRYRTSETGSYDLTTAPTVTNVADSKKVYYQVTATNYTTASGSFNCNITKATMGPTASDNSKTYNGNALTCNGDTWTGVPDGSTKYYSTDNGTTYTTTVPQITNVADSKTIKWKVTNPNYNDATGSFSCTVNKADCGMTLSSASGSVTYPTTSGSFTANNACGTLSVSSSDETVVTASLSSNTVNLTYKKAGSATITVTSAESANYKVISKTYSASASNKTITLNKNGGSGTCGGASSNTNGSMTCSYGGTCTAPTYGSSCSISKGTGTSSKVFIGWAESSSATTATYAMGADIKNAATTLYAVWGTPVCSITKGSATIATSVDNKPTCAVTCATGYKTSGTYSGSANQVNYSYTCSPITYTVVYNANKPSTASANVSGTTANSSHTYDTAKNLTSNGYTLTGWTFQGWATSSTGAVAHTNGKSVSNLTTTDGGTVNLYAVWTPVVSGAITLNTNGGDTVSPTTIYTKYDTGVYSDTTVTTEITTLTTIPKKEFYKFKGFYTLSSGGVQVVGANGNFTAEAKRQVSTAGATPTWYAQWAPLYTLTFDKNGGNGGTDYLYWSYGDVVDGIYTDKYGTESWSYSSIIRPSRTGYTFGGYEGQSSYGNLIIDANGNDTNAHLVTGHMLQNTDITLTARWNANTNTITLNGNGATGGKIKNISMTSGAVTFTCETDSSMTPPTWNATDSENTTSLVKTNKVFKGWATTQGATTPNMPSTCPAADTTYYAVWADASCSDSNTSVVTATLTGVTGNAPVCTVVCVAGYYGGGTGKTGTAGTQTFTPTCSACSGLGTGYTSDQGQNASNTSCYLLLSGKVRSGETGTTTTDCNSGKYKATNTKQYYGTSYSCDTCSAGTYSPTSGAITSCTACSGATQYQNEAGKTSCKTVDTGYYKTNNSTQTQCPVNYRDGAGASSQAGCIASCAATTAITTANGACTTQGTGYWAKAHTVTYGNTSVLNTDYAQCPTNYQTGAVASSQSGCSTTCSAGYAVLTENNACATIQNSTYKGKYTTQHTVTYGSTSTISTCPTNYQVANGTTAQSNCETQCSAGTHVASPNAACSAITTNNKYSVQHNVKYGNTTTLSDCDTTHGYTNSGTTAAAHANQSSCKITCEAGKRVVNASEACSTPKGSWYTAEHIVSEGTTSGTNVQSCLSNYYTPDTTTQGDHNESADCKISCEAGTRLTTANNTSCTAITSGNVYMLAHSVAQGSTSADATSCPTGYTISGSTQADHNEKSDCKITCGAGQVVANNDAQCSVPTSGYQTGSHTISAGSKTPTAADSTSPSAGTWYSCLTNYTASGTSASNHDQRSDCKITCSAGTQIASNNATSCTTPSGSWYKTQHTVSAGSKTSPSSCATGYSTPNTTTATDHDQQADCKTTCSAGNWVASAGAACSSVGDGYYSTASQTIAEGSVGSRNACTALNSDYTHSDNGRDATTDCFLNTVATKYVATAKANQVTCAENGYCPGNVKVYYNSIGGRTACTTGLFAHAGAWRVAQCGHKMHVDGADYNDVMYLHSDKVTTPSFNAKWNNQTWYANMVETPTNMSTYSTHKFKTTYGGKTYYVCDDTTCPQ